MNGVLQFVLRLFGIQETTRDVEKAAGSIDSLKQQAGQLSTALRGFGQAGTAATVMLSSMGQAMQGNTQAMLTMALAAGQFWRGISVLNPVMAAVTIGATALIAVGPKIKEFFESAETKAERARAELEKLGVVLSSVNEIKLDADRKVAALKAIAEAGSLSADALRDLMSVMSELNVQKLTLAQAEIERRQAEIESRTDILSEDKARQIAELGFQRSALAADAGKIAVDREVADARAAADASRSALLAAKSEQTAREAQFQRVVKSFEARLAGADTPEARLKLQGEQRQATEPLFDQIEAGRRRLAAMQREADLRAHAALAVEGGADERKRTLDARRGAEDAGTAAALDRALREGPAAAAMAEADQERASQRRQKETADRAHAFEMEELDRQSRDILKDEALRQDAAGARRRFDLGGMTPEQLQADLARQAAELSPLKDNPAFAPQYWDVMGRLRGTMERETYGLQASSLQDVFKAAYGFGDDPARRSAVTLERIERLVKDLTGGGVPQ